VTYRPDNMTDSVKMLPPPRYMIRRNPANIKNAYENELPNKRTADKETRTQSNETRQSKQKEQPFAAKVRRKWEDAKSKVSRKLGLYTWLEPLPIGMYIDMVI